MGINRVGKKLRRHQWHFVPIERDERFHPHIEALIAQPIGTELVYGPVATEEQAKDAYLGLCRARAHYKKTMQLSAAVFYKQRPDGQYEVRFRRHDPEEAKEYIQAKLAREEGTL